MSLSSNTLHRSRLPSTRRLGVASIALAVIAVVPLVQGPKLLTIISLGLVAVGGIGSLTYERRQHARRAVVRSVSCFASGRHEIHHMRTLDLSSDGFFVETSMPYPLLTRFRFELTLVPGERPIQGHGVVRWINLSTPEGMGIEVLRLDEPDRIRRFLEDEQQRGILRLLTRSTAPPDPATGGQRAC